MKTSTPYKAEDGTWRIDGVEIVSTGIEYPLASGPHTFTEEELADAVQAAADDVAIRHPRIKLGHTSDYNLQLVGDAEQAFGRVENMQLTANKQTIIGDYVGTPEWLATVLPSAYPSRSVDASLEVETVTGKQYSMVITAACLLGVRWPGCTVLEDLPLWYGAEIPEGVEIDTDQEAVIAASGGMMKFRRKGVEAAVDVSKIRRKFYADGPGSEDWHLWIRGERFDSEDGFNLIVDMGDGELSRYPVTVTGDDVEFGEAVLVTEQYPDKAVAASAVLAGMRLADPAMIIHASRADTEADRPDNSTQEGGALSDEHRKKLAAGLGLPEDATEEQIKAKITEVNATIGESGIEGPKLAEPSDKDPEDLNKNTGGAHDEGLPTSGNTGTEGVPPKEGDTLNEKPVEAAKGDTVTVDRATLESLKAGSDLATKHEQERNEDRVNTLVASAVEDGRIPPARADHWKAALKADFDGNKEVLATLEKNLIPVNQRGTGGGGGEEELTAGTEGFQSLFPEIPSILAAAQKPRPVLQAREG